MKNFCRKVGHSVKVNRSVKAGRSVKTNRSVKASHSVKAGRCRHIITTQLQIIYSVLSIVYGTKLNYLSRQQIHNQLVFKIKDYEFKIPQILARISREGVINRKTLTTELIKSLDTLVKIQQAFDGAINNVNPIKCFSQDFIKMFGDESLLLKCLNLYKTKISRERKI